MNFFRFFLSLKMKVHRNGMINFFAFLFFFFSLFSFIWPFRFAQYYFYYNFKRILIWSWWVSKLFSMFIYCLLIGLDWIGIEMCRIWFWEMLRKKSGMRRQRVRNAQTNVWILVCNEMCTFCISTGLSSVTLHRALVYTIDSYLNTWFNFGHKMALNFAQTSVPFLVLRMKLFTHKKRGNLSKACRCFVSHLKWKCCTIQIEVMYKSNKLLTQTKMAIVFLFFFCIRSYEFRSDFILFGLEFRWV